MLLEDWRTTAADCIESGAEQRALKVGRTQHSTVLGSLEVGAVLKTRRGREENPGGSQLSLTLRQDFGPGFLMGFLCVFLI